MIPYIVTNNKNKVHILPFKHIKSIEQLNEQGAQLLSKFNNFDRAEEENSNKPYRYVYMLILVYPEDDFSFEKNTLDDIYFVLYRTVYFGVSSTYRFLRHLNYLRNYFLNYDATTQSVRKY